MIEVANHHSTIVSINTHSIAVDALTCFILLFSKVIPVEIRVFGPLGLFNIKLIKFSVFKELLNLLLVISYILNQLFLFIFKPQHNFFNLSNDILNVEIGVIVSKAINYTNKLDTLIVTINVFIEELIPIRTQFTE